MSRKRCRDTLKPPSTGALERSCSQAGASCVSWPCQSYVSAEAGAALARFGELRLAAERETCLSVWVPAVPWPRV